MNAFVAEYLLLNPVTAGLGTITALLAGALVCHLTRTVTAELPRAKYFVALAVTGLIPLLGMTLWFAMPGAAQSGTLWLPVAAQLLIAAGGGYLLYWASAARANHMSGNTSLAWVGLIPLANLILLFWGREDRLPPDERKLTGGEIGGLIAAGIAVFLIGRGVEGAILDSIAGLSWPRSLDEVAAGTPAGPPKTLAERFAEEAALAQPDLPIQISAGESLTAVTAEGTRLTLTHLFDSETFPPFPPSITDQTRRELCRDRSFRAEIAEGGEIVYRFTRPDGLVLASIVVSQKTC